MLRDGGGGTAPCLCCSSLAAVWVLPVCLCLNVATRGVSLQTKSGLLALITHRALPSQYPMLNAQMLAADELAVGTTALYQGCSLSQLEAPGCKEGMLGYGIRELLGDAPQDKRPRRTCV